MEKTANPHFLNKLNKVAQVFILLFVAECTLGSSGRWLSIGPLSIRIILFIIAFALSLPCVIAKFKETFLNFTVISTLIFGVYFAISIVLGIKNGNNFGFIVADVTTFMSLALTPAFIAVMCNKKAIERAVNTIFYASGALSVVVVILHIVMAFANKSFVAGVNGILNEYSLGGFANLSTGIQRIYLRSEIFLQVAIVYGIWLFGKAQGKIKWLISFLEGCLFCAFILSYTRGFWFGLAVAAVVLLIVGIKYFKQYLKLTACMLCAFVAFSFLSSALYGGPFVAAEVVNRFNPNLIVISGTENNGTTVGSENNVTDSSVSEEDIAAANVRNQTLIALKEEIANKLIFGHGLGKNLDNVRDDGRTEYMYLDIILKMGIIGFVLFVAVFFGFIVIQIKSYLKKRKNGVLSFNSATVRNLFLTVGYLSVAVTSFFNPFLNNPMGIMLLLVTLTAVYEENNANKTEV